MKEIEVKNTIKQSMAEPKAPKELELATIERGKAIELGRMAEQKLASLNDAAPSPSIKALAARSIVGRVAQVKKLSQGVTADFMANELLKNEKFQQATNLTADKLLSGIQNGSLLKSMVSAKVTHSSEAPKKGFEGPTI